MAVILSLAGREAVAATTTQIPGSAIPGRQMERTAPEQPAMQPKVKISPPAHEQVMPPNAGQLEFNLKKITVEGATVFNDAALSDLWQPYLGKKISIATVYGIADAITRRYANAGYILSFAVVPVQKIDEGNATIRVVEGFVDEVNFTGDFPSLSSDLPNGRLASVVRNVLNSKPLKESDLERYLLIVNDLPGAYAHATFTASPDVQGASTLTVDIQRERMSVEGDLDNRLPYYLSRWASSASATVNGLVNDSDSFSLTGGCGIFCDVYQEISGRWSTLLGSKGLKLSAEANTSYDAPAEGFLHSLSFWGRRTEASTSLDYPLLQAREQSLSVGAGFDVVNSSTSTYAGIFTRDYTRALDLHTRYAFSDAWGGASFLHASLQQGVPLLGATSYNDPLKSRVNGDSTYTLFQVDISHEHPLAALSPLLEGFSFYTAGWGQFDLANPLLSATQCSYGGGYIGHGYDSGSLNGDHCLMGLAELRRNLWVGGILLQPYLSADAGAVWEKGPLVPGDQRFLGAESVGGGLRFTHNSWVSGDFSVAQPLRSSIAEMGHEDPRVFLTLQVRW